MNNSEAVTPSLLATEFAKRRPLTAFGSVGRIIQNNQIIHSPFPFDSRALESDRNAVEPARGLQN